MFVQQIEVWLTKEDKKSGKSILGMLINEELVVCERESTDGKLETFAPKEVWDYYVYSGMTLVN